MKVALVLLAALGLIGLVTVAASLLVPACGLRLPFGGAVIFACPVATEPAAPSDDAFRASLQQDISALELQVAGLQCAAPALVQPSAPPPSLPDEKLDENMIERADLGALSGCWQLESAYAAQNMVTGVVIDFPEWTVCFDGAGNGTETMRGSDGSICEGPVTGSFVPGESLVIEEAADLPCSGNFAILRRRVTCRLDESQRTACESYQPEGGGTADVTMRRQMETP